MTSYVPQIEAHAAAAGLAPTPEQIQVANTLLQGRIETFVGGLTLVDGQVANPVAAIAEACRWFPKAQEPAPARPPEPIPAAPAPPSRFTGQTAAALARVAANGATVAQTAHDTEQMAYAQQLATGPNPWRTGNQTNQYFIRKYLPDVAAQLKAKVM